MNNIDKAIEAIKNDLKYHTKKLKPHYRENLLLAIQALEDKKRRDNMRCENCLWYEEFECGNYRSPFVHDYRHTESEPIDFCSYFEPKEEVK